MAGPGFERFRHNRAGYLAVLKSGGVKADLGRRAQQVKAAAQSQIPAGERDIELIADTQVGKNRAGATVIGIPMRLEVDHRILGRSIDAAR